MSDAVFVVAVVVVVGVVVVDWGGVAVVLLPVMLFVLFVSLVLLS